MTSHYISLLLEAPLIFFVRQGDLAARQRFTNLGIRESLDLAQRSRSRQRSPPFSFQFVVKSSYILYVLFHFQNIPRRWALQFYKCGFINNISPKFVRHSAQNSEGHPPAMTTTTTTSGFPKNDHHSEAKNRFLGSGLVQRGSAPIDNALFMSFVGKRGTVDKHVSVVLIKVDDQSLVNHTKKNLINFD